MGPTRTGRILTLLVLLAGVVVGQYIQTPPPYWYVVVPPGPLASRPAFWFENLVGGGTWVHEQNPHPVADGIGWSYDFPQWQASNGWWIGYTKQVTKKATMSGTLTAELVIETTGTPIFRHDSEVGNEGGPPSAMRLYFESSDGNRWWSTGDLWRVVLAPGGYVLSVPLLPENWSETYGHWGGDPAWAPIFTADLKIVTVIGLSFGGGSFYGHGVAVEGGTARFRLVSYTVTP